jgi:hypothetical protein
MAEKVGSVYIEIQAKMGTLEKDLKTLESRLNQTSKMGSNLSGTFTRLASGLGVSAAIYKIVGAYKDAIKAGSDLQETQNKFDVVFRESKKQADIFAKALVDSYGLATQESMAFLAGTGDILIGMGMASDKALELANGVATLGIDLASFSNVAGGSERAIAALTSALTGEREALKAYGIVVNEELIKAELVATGKDKLTGMARKQAESEATLAIAYRQSGNAIGDMARSFDSYANIQRRVDSQMADFEASIGTMLIPAMSNLGLAFLGASKDGGFLGDSLRAITKYVADTINGVAILIAKLDQMRGTSQADRLRDEAAAEQELYKTRIKSTEQLVKSGQLSGDELKRVQEENKRVLASSAEKTKNAENFHTKELEMINNVAKIQKRIADEENGIVQQTVVKKSAAAEQKVAIEQKLTAEQKKELEKRAEYTKLYGSQEMADFVINAEKKMGYYSQIANVANGFASQLSNLANMSASNQTARIDNELTAQQEALNAQYEADVAAVNAEVITQEEKDAKLKALDEKKARDSKALEDAAAKEKRKIARENAKIQKQLAIFQVMITAPQAAMSAYAALSGIPFVGPALGMAAAIATLALGAKQIQLIQEQPLPALAEGGIVPSVPGGNKYTLGEGGSREAVIPLDSRGKDVLKEVAGGGLPTQITLMVDGEEFGKWIYNTTKNGQTIYSKNGMVA